MHAGTRRRRTYHIVPKEVGLVALLAAAAAFTPYALAATVGEVIAAQQGADRAAQESQKRIDQLDDQTQDAVQKYRRALDDTKSLNSYNAHLRQQVEAQRAEIVKIDDQLATIETTSREVFPLMTKMVNTLAQLVEVDVPFHEKERKARVENLRALMERADVTVSEKYRRILEAYQIELEYGRTLDSYEGTLGEGEGARAVQFIRLGRIALMYQLPDASETGYWNVDTKQWVVDNDLKNDVTHALHVAQKRGAPELLWVPVPAPKE
jgi:hypothetical protein